MAVLWVLFVVTLAVLSLLAMLSIFAANTYLDDEGRPAGAGFLVTAWATTIAALARRDEQAPL